MTTAHTELWAEVVKQATDGDVEETITAIAKWMECEASLQEHPAVKSCCEAATEELKRAAFSFYASTK